MNRNKQLAIAVPSFPLSVVSPFSASLPAKAAHDHAQGTQTPLQLNAGQKWETDAPLRKGMNAIHEQVSGALPKAHANSLTDAEYDALAEAVSGQFTYIVQNCHLKPEADAQLHIVLGHISQGIETVRGKEAGHPRPAGLLKIAQSLNAYGEHFNHQGWKPIDLAH